MYFRFSLCLCVSVVSTLFKHAPESTDSDRKCNRRADRRRNPV